MGGGRNGNRSLESYTVPYVKLECSILIMPYIFIVQTSKFDET